MDNRKKSILIGAVVAVVLVVLGVIAGIRIFGGFQPEKYVSAVLKQTMKGEVDAVTRMTKGLSKDEAQIQYELVVSEFMNQVILADVSLNDEQKAACLAVCKKMFYSMKYEVKDAEKLRDGEYRVAVKIQKSDVLEQLKHLLNEETNRIYAKMEAAEYSGTLDEVEKQMKAEYASNLPGILKKAYEMMAYGEKETVYLTVTRGDNGLYSVVGADLNNFIIKIMGLTTNQD